MEKKFYGVSLGVLLSAFVLVVLFLTLRELLPYLLGSGFTPLVISTPFVVIFILIMLGWISIKGIKLVRKFFKEENHEED